ncbi:signal recognition particle-docking protein FtsY [Magnetospira sp. QH-2]|uniref:signal recognition particle-docking protein FtsY n=1 Tax=Magnetospira sp. (strain QH-2) TaxID=1288970 RepID=UPI0003E818D7|nr:signal recognition particle-docking protein FtsY [Magnetospira sp. QH-2]CCQ72558.1 Cell division transporter substrate-binding protein FtsY (Signal recognition particle receptor) [Magnetospira sp. QH-2]
MSYKDIVDRADEQDDGDQKSGWLGKLKTGLSRSSTKLVGGISDLVTKRLLDDDALNDLEDLLITTDMGMPAATRAVEAIAESRFGKENSSEEIREEVAAVLTESLEPVAHPLRLNPELKPHVVLVCGVNGSGKTTTIGKLAKQDVDQGRKVMLAAGDTFRAAAVEQLKIWGDRTNSPVIARELGSDAAGLAFDALEQAKTEGADVLYIDTAGRLQNKAGLMDELKKIIRVMRKVDETAPHTCLLVLDATVGQNALSQVETFKAMVDVDGLALTKLDGTAKGGVIIALADKFGLPVHAVGVGEGVEDLRPFEARAFARNLLGLEA